MKKICLTVVGMYFMLLHAFSQVSGKDSSSYQRKRLKIDEINLVSSYYNQTADKSAVSGGKTDAAGNGDVTDLSNGLEIKLVGWDRKGRRNTLTAGLGLDYHTAASQAYVNLKGTAKNDGKRTYPTLSWSLETPRKGTEFNLGTYYSAEHNYYHSLGVDIGFSKRNKTNGEFSAKLTGYFDRIKMIYPSELVPADSTGTSASGVIYQTTASGATVVLSSSGTVISTSNSTVPSESRDTYTASFSYSQVVNPYLQGAIFLDLVAQTGYLGLPFHRVYFNTGDDSVEHLPSSRFKLPVGLRLNYFMGDRIIFRSFYRFYVDNWGVLSQTASLEVPVKITPFLSVSPFYRYYHQTASNYFAPYEQHSLSDHYYTSNYALSNFSSQLLGAGIRLAPPGGIFHSSMSTAEIRYGYYTQTTDLASNVISIHLTFK